MKLQYFFSLIILPAFTSTVVAQKVETNITWLTNIPDAANNIIYNPLQKLTIEDFKGSSDESASAAAITSSGFMFTAGYHSKNGKATLSVAVYCSFDKQESWMKEKGKTAYILTHEQHHFDISYLNTLQFIKKLKQTKFNQENYMEQLKDIYKKVVQDMKNMQHQYDEETGNGINTARQEDWNKKIDEQVTVSAKETAL